MALPAAPGGSTRAEQIAYYASLLAKVSGTYQGNYAQYDGYTWAALYETLANGNPSADPRQLAGAVVIMEGAQRLGTGTAAAEKTLGSFIAVAPESAIEGLDQVGKNVPAPLSGLAAIGDFFSRLTQASTWLRLLEAVLGAGLILVGLAHVAGNTQAGRTARKIATRAALL